ncbi:unnamed protein product [Cylicocyclus nassatus]|uniref:Uncharacterized protein n=1 Tax=Cylicocyclus nassatus TaxID=53992 RepID=A0AA36DWI0_CYLNA|nr:unnamed protein product [Cylicocyclus nassatus]
MDKRKSGGLPDAEQPCCSKTVRNDSSSSSTGEEWLCASTKVPSPTDLINLPPTRPKRKPDPSLSWSSRRAVKAKRLSAPISTIPNVNVEPSAESVSDASPSTSSIQKTSERHQKSEKLAKNIKLRRTSLPWFMSMSVSKNRKVTPANADKSSKWPSFPKLHRKDVVLELTPTKAPTSDEYLSRSYSSSVLEKILVEESPLKTDDHRPASVREVSAESVADSQITLHLERSRSLENIARELLHSSKSENETTCRAERNFPPVEAPDKGSVSNDVPMLLDSSPDEKSEKHRSDAGNGAALSVETRSSASGGVVPCTQDLVADSDDESQLRSELYDIDEVTRLVPRVPSTEEDTGTEKQSDEESSSDEDDSITRNLVTRMNLFGRARKFAEYVLARRSERIMIKRDPNVSTKTYEVERTVSAWGMSVSWLKPKMVMFAPPFSRNPTTVTLALPLLTIPNKYDPETTFIVNPIIVSTTQDAGPEAT